MQVSAFDWIERYAYRYPDKNACVDVDAGRTLTYRELNDRACRLASFLVRDLGVAKGDRVSILAHNSVEFLALEAACVKTGAIMVPLNWRLTVPELAYQVRQSEPTVLLFGDDFMEKANDLATQCTIGHLVGFRYDGLDSSLQCAIQSADPAFESVRVYHDDPWMIYYTSGTTGFPKGAVATHGTVFFNSVNYALFLHVSSAAVSLCVLPLFHTGGLNQCCNPSLHCGGTVVLCRQFDPGQVLKLISDPAIGITHVLGVPTMLLMLSQHPDFDKVDFSRLVSMVVGGAPVSAVMHRLWRERGVYFQEGYGLTEGGPSVLTSDGDQPLSKAGSAGKPMLHVEVRLVKPDGLDVPAGEIGEIWIRGPAVSPGYWNNPEATKKSFCDGWFMTGDAARRDADGYYYIVDRWKDMYISGGENVYPAEIENALYEMPEIAEVAVIGVADEKWGEVGFAAVVVKPGLALTADQIIGHCRGRLATFKIPKSVVFIDAVPRNAMNKVLKDKLREKLGVGPLIRK